MKKFWALLIVFVLTSATAFANSSIVIENSQQKDVLSRIMKYLVKQGSTLENVSDYSFTAYNVNTSLLVKFFAGSNPEIRFMFSAVQDNKDVVLSLGMKSTYHAGSAYNQNVYAYQFQEKEILDVLKKALKGYYTYGFDGKKTRKGYKITAVYYDENKVNENLSVGDVITEINKHPVKGMSKTDVKIKLTPLKNNNHITVNLKDCETKTNKEIKLKSFYVKPTI